MRLPPLHLNHMIDKTKLTDIVEAWLADKDFFLTELNVSPDNNITVEIDGENSVDIDSCADLTRTIGDAFDRDIEDYELEVGSAGLTSPLKVRRQFLKYIGKDMEVLTRDGRKLYGVLTEVTPGDGEPVEFTIDVPTKVKPEGAKKPIMQNVPTQLSSDACKYVRYDLKF